MTATKPLGTYGNAVGTVTPADHKAAQSGLIAKTSGNAVRAGLFWGGTANIITAKPNMSYDVAQFTAALSRGATSGTVLLANDGTLNVATTAAPGSNSRIDIIYVWAREYSLDGVDSNPVIGVAQGAAAAVPVAPSLAGFPGAIELGRATVGAGITATTSATITQTAPFTCVDGGRIPFRTTTERDAGTYVEGQLGWLLDTDALQVYNGTTWANVGATPGSYARRIRTAGTYGPSATTWTDLTASFWDSAAPNDITLAGAIGDVIEVSLSTIADVQATETYWNVTCVTSGNGFGPTGASARGIAGWMAANGVVTPISGVFHYTVVSGDISSGNVALRLRSRNASAVGKNHLATADSPFVWTARNLGKVG